MAAPALSDTRDTRDARPVTGWDIFCRVIDNHGDVGVTWRLAADLASRGHAVRLWLDDVSALSWMAPHGVHGTHDTQGAPGAPGVQVLHWTPGATASAQPRQVVVEAFGCELDDPFKSAMARSAAPPVWINLEYLSAESFARRSHGLPSPQAVGAAAGLTKWFFYPGFEPGTGGLLREPELAARRARFDPAAWLAAHGVAPDPGQALISLFCYEPAALPGLLRALARPLPDGRHAHLLVTPGRTAQAVRAAWHAGATHSPAPGQPPGPRITWLPWLTQTDYDHLLWSTELNFVRGEDSLVRAIWAGQPLVWQLYPQEDGAHAAKLEAFIALVERTAGRACGDAFAAWSTLMRGWNGVSTAGLPEPVAGTPHHPKSDPNPRQLTHVPDWRPWQPMARALAHALAQPADLTTALVAFVTEKS